MAIAASLAGCKTKMPEPDRMFVSFEYNQSLGSFSGLKRAVLAREQAVSKMARDEALRDEMSALAEYGSANDQLATSLKDAEKKGYDVDELVSKDNEMQKEVEKIETEIDHHFFG